MMTADQKYGTAKAMKGYVRRNTLELKAGVGTLVILAGCWDRGDYERYARLVKLLPVLAK